MGNHRGQPKGRLARFGLSRAGRIILAGAALAVVAGLTTTASVAAYNFTNDARPAVGTSITEVTPPPSDFIQPRHAMPATPPPVVRTYTVRQGDSLWKIAHDELGNGTKWNVIAADNGIPAPYLLQTGEILTL